MNKEHTIIEEVILLNEERLYLKKLKKYQEADKIREEIFNKGYKLQDVKENQSTILSSKNYKIIIPVNDKLQIFPK
jgi:cysteinyl-tRNA synthetase